LTTKISAICDCTENRFTFSLLENRAWKQR
jgi:hypothetical protein